MGADHEGRLGDCKDRGMLVLEQQVLYNMVGRSFFFALKQTYIVNNYVEMNGWFSAYRNIASLSAFFKPQSYEFFIALVLSTPSSPSSGMSEMSRYCDRKTYSSWHSCRWR